MPCGYHRPCLLQPAIVSVNTTPALVPTPTAFMLDLDGTLVDTLGDFVAVLNRVMADMALPEVSRAFVEHTIGQGSEHLIRSVLAEAGAPQQRYEEAWTLYQRHYEVLNGEHADVFPGVVEGLDALKALGLPIGLISNAGLTPGVVLRRIMDTHGLLEHFDHTIFSDEVELAKPSEAIFTHALEAFGVEPAEAAFLGDQPVLDVLGPRNAGIWSIQIGGRFHLAFDDLAGTLHFIFRRLEQKLVVHLHDHLRLELFFLQCLVNTDHRDLHDVACGSLDRHIDRLALGT